MREKMSNSSHLSKTFDNLCSASRKWMRYVAILKKVSSKNKLSFRKNIIKLIMNVTIATKLIKWTVSYKKLQTDSHLLQFSVIPLIQGGCVDLLQSRMSPHMNKFHFKWIVIEIAVSFFFFFFSWVELISQPIEQGIYVFSLLRRYLPYFIDVFVLDDP